MEKRLLDALSFDSWNLAVPKLIVKNKAAVDAHGCVLYFVHTWASALLVLTIRAMPEPQLWDD